MAAHFELFLSDWYPHHQQGGLPLVGTQQSSDMLGLQLHNYNPVKYERAICLPHKGRGIPLSALPKDTTSKLAGLFSTLSFFMLSAKQGSCEYHFLKSFGMTRLRNEAQVYRLQCGRSNRCTIAPVVFSS